MPKQEPAIDFAALADFLKALSYPTRLELLDALRLPRMVGEIKVSPQRLSEGDNPDRAVARQTLQAHLDKLVAAGIVREENVQLGERAVRRYSVNPSKLYAITEEMSRLATRHAGRGVEGDTTATFAGETPARTDPPGPRLVLVHGMYEGKSFRLAPELASGGGWTIGRKRGLPVGLDYDPFVSSENARVVLQDGEFAVEDLAQSRNGTRLNWEPLPSGLARRLEPGDVIGVGRSLLVFRRT